MSITQRGLSFRTRWLIWRARLSAPALLALHDERKAVSWVAGVNGGLAILTIGLFAWFTDLPLLFPALGPSAFILFNTPMAPAAAPRSVILGHLTAMICGYGAWHLVGLAAGEPVSVQNSGWPPICSASLALGACCLLLTRLSYAHPPACASGLVVALGAVTHGLDLLLMLLAVVWLTAQAVIMNRLAGLPVPTWLPRQREM